MSTRDEPSSEGRGRIDIDLDGDESAATTHEDRHRPDASVRSHLGLRRTTDDRDGQSPTDDARSQPPAIAVHTCAVLALPGERGKHFGQGPVRSTGMHAGN